jgi:predicted DNA-binding protein
MITLTLNLPQEVEQELEKDFSYLEKTTKKPREYLIKEALIRYMEDPKEVKETEKYIKKNNLSRDFHLSEALIRYIEYMEDIGAVEK